MTLTRLSDAMWGATFDQKLPGGFVFPARMTVVEAAPGELLIHSPIPLSAELVAAIEGLGEVRWIVAPNNFHHLHLPAAVEAFPDAAVYGAPGAIAKHKEVDFTGSLDDGAPAGLPESVVVFEVGGAPLVSESVFWLPDDDSLICTDLVFNMHDPANLMTRMLLWMIASGDDVYQTKTFRYLFVKDRPRFSESLSGLVERDFERLVMAHGDVVTERGAERLGRAAEWILKTNKMR